MAKQTINNGDGGATVRGALNANFTELYGGVLATVVDAVAARTALGLGSAATAAFGTTAGTAAQGNDSRIVGAVQPGGALGTPSSGDLTHCAGLPVGGITGVLPIANGGTGVGASAQTLTYGATVSWDVSSGPFATLTLIGSGATITPANMVAGQTYVLKIVQDATGSRTVGTWTGFKWAGGSAPTLSTAANAVDVITGIYDGASLLAAASKAFA